jgi:hypothetical protein
MAEANQRLEPSALQTASASFRDVRLSFLQNATYIIGTGIGLLSLRLVTLKSSLVEELSKPGVSDAKP